MSRSHGHISSDLCVFLGFSKNDNNSFSVNILCCIFDGALGENE